MASHQDSESNDIRLRKMSAELAIAKVALENARISWEAELRKGQMLHNGLKEQQRKVQEITAYFVNLAELDSQRKIILQQEN